MGCDIHPYAEQWIDGQWEALGWPDAFDGYPRTGPFDWRIYTVFAWLADVRNSFSIQPISQPRGLPSDISDRVRSEYFEDAHSASWLSVRELLDYDYDQPLNVDLPRLMPDCDCGKSYRNFLGESFHRDLKLLAKLEELAPTRVVFWFDS